MLPARLVLASTLALGAVSPAVGAPCINGSLSTLTTCTISIGSGPTFTLSNWSLSGVSLSGFGGTELSPSDFFVSFATSGSDFSVTFSDVAGGSNGFAATSGQYARWTVGFAVAQPAGTSLRAYSTQASSVSGIGSLTVGGVAADGGSTLARNDLAFSGNPALQTLGSNPEGENLSATPTFFSVSKTLEMAGITGNGIGLIAITSTLSTVAFPSEGGGSQVPVPASVALLGIGLAGLAAARRATRRLASPGRGA